MTTTRKKRRHSRESGNRVITTSVHPEPVEGYQELGESLKVREVSTPYLAKPQQPRHSREDGNPEKPKWQLKRLRDFARTASGGTPKRDRPQFYGEPIPWIKSGELGDGVVREAGESITQLGLDSSSAKVFPKGTLCIALYGATVGRLGILGIEAATNQAVCGIFPSDDVDTKYLFYFLFSRRGALIREAKGGAQPNISQEIIRELWVPVPPLDEQRRTVAELETQLTRLDASVTALKRVQANLKRYRASVLIAACEGRLVPTEAELARHEGRAFEPGAHLVARIRAIRSDDQRAKGKTKEPIEPDALDLLKVPEGWAVASIDQVCSHITSGSRDWSQFYGKGTGTFILAQNVRPLKLDLSERQAVDAPAGDAQTERTKVQFADLLVTIVGAKTGDVCRVPVDLSEHYVCQSVALLRPVMQTVSKFIEIFWLQRRTARPFGSVTSTGKVVHTSASNS